MNVTHITGFTLTLCAALSGSLVACGSDPSHPRGPPPNLDERAPTVSPAGPAVPAPKSPRERAECERLASLYGRDDPRVSPSCTFGQWADVGASGPELCRASSVDHWTPMPIAGVARELADSVLPMWAGCWLLYDETGTKPADLHCEAGPFDLSTPLAEIDAAYDAAYLAGVARVKDTGLVRPTVAGYRLLTICVPD